MIKVLGCAFTAGAYSAPRGSCCSECGVLEAGFMSMQGSVIKVWVRIHCLLENAQASAVSGVRVRG